MASTRISTASASSPDVLQRGDMVYALYYRDQRALTCALSVEGDGIHVVQVTRLWDDESFAETFTRLEEALERQAEIGSFLHDSGWLLVERALVPLAA